MPKSPSVTTAGAEAIKHLTALPGMHQAVVGLSGGVDSSLTAALLVEAGWAIEGLTLWLMSGKGACCSDGLIDAAGICEELGIPHNVLDSRNTFQETIVNQLLEGYKAGLTPIPCTRCNRSVKFNLMLNWAQKERNIDRIATGHYARVHHANNIKTNQTSEHEIPKRHKLLRGLDKNKDQSYFLYDLSQDVLEKVIFPLGELTKADTRKEADRLNLRTAKKEESQDLCLADHHGSMRAFLDNYLPPKKGEITLKNGTVLGEHDGIEHFTIGQRKGLRVAWKEPLHVVRIDAALNRIIVAPRSEAGKSNCLVGEINWISIPPPNKTINVEVQIRYRSLPVKAKLTPINETYEDIERDRPYRCLLTFYEEQFSITPGQAAVFYSGDIVLGGGLIKPNDN